VQALQGVDVVIEDGDWLAIQGPTGHGKSTLLQILGGLDRPTSGTVELDGRNISALRESRLTKVRATSIGFIFQTFNLIPACPRRRTWKPPRSRSASIPPSAGNGPRRLWRKSGSATVGDTFPRRCPADSSSASPWPGHWSSARACCSPTSRPAARRARNIGQMRNGKLTVRARHALD
jgi:hypothetical protein